MRLLSCVLIGTEAFEQKRIKSILTVFIDKNLVNKKRPKQFRCIFNIMFMSLYLTHVSVLYSFEHKTTNIQAYNIVGDVIYEVSITRENSKILCDQ